jgi:hypothetical protein
MIKVENITLICAFRYALGRRTYIVGIITDELKRNWKNLTEVQQILIQREIKDAIEEEYIGDKCDQQEWQTILNLKIREE